MASVSTGQINERTVRGEVVKCHVRARDFSHTSWTFGWSVKVETIKKMSKSNKAFGARGKGMARSTLKNKGTNALDTLYRSLFAKRSFARPSVLKAHVRSFRPRSAFYPNVLGLTIICVVFST